MSMCFQSSHHCSNLKFFIEFLCYLRNARNYPPLKDQRHQHSVTHLKTLLVFKVKLLNNYSSKGDAANSSPKCLVSPMTSKKFLSSQIYVVYLYSHFLQFSALQSDLLF
ncbi:hypothetical protein Pfo_023996 [Paulownia fortunei]|nr:hypothetical protein Pfo_023996 [Paulownia fortunei]